MTTELEIDKDEFDAFVRHTLNLSAETPVTEFHSGLVQDKIAGHEADLLGWLEKRRAKESKPQPPPPFLNMKNDPPPPSAPKPGASQPSPQQPRGALGKPAGVPVKTAAPRGPGTIRRRVITGEPKKGGFGFLSTLILGVLVLITVVYALPAYVSLEKREEIAKAEWTKSVPGDLVQTVLFRGQNTETAVSLQRNVPMRMPFSSKKPFRLNATLRMGSPALDTIRIRAQVEPTSGGERFSQMLELEEGQREVEFETKLPAGDFEIRLQLETELTADKLPADLQVAIRY